MATLDYYDNKISQKVQQVTNLEHLLQEITDCACNLYASSNPNHYDESDRLSVSIDLDIAKHQLAILELKREKEYTRLVSPRIDVFVESVRLASDTIRSRYKNILDEYYQVLDNISSLKRQIDDMMILPFPEQDYMVRRRLEGALQDQKNRLAYVTNVICAPVPQEVLSCSTKDEAMAVLNLRLAKMSDEWYESIVARLHNRAGKVLDVEHVDVDEFGGLCGYVICAHEIVHISGRLYSPGGKPSVYSKFRLSIRQGRVSAEDLKEV